MFSPVALYFALAQEETHSALLDSCGWQGKTGGFYFMGFEAQEIIREWPPLAIQNSREPYAGFRDGWIGVLSYELNHLLEPSVPQAFRESPMGLAYFVRFKHRILWNPETGQYQILSDDPMWVEKVNHVLKEEPPERRPLLGWEGEIQQSMSQEIFEAQAAKILEEIQAGNLYQANLSLRFEISDISNNMLPSIYEALIRQNPSPFSGVFWTPEGIILSNSPERLVKYDAQTNMIETRPIAGTRGRGQTVQEDEEIGTRLQANPKELAEHAMLVDLERNDLGKVCIPGTVQVKEEYSLEKYAHVTHLVSQIEGQKRPESSPWDIIQAMFPGGTITGCPKIRCMQTLAELEPVPRWLYTGSFGYIDISGNLDFNILIRSLFHWPDGRLHFHAGAGIVADSQPAWEYKECLRKAQTIRQVLGAC